MTWSLAFPNLLVGLREGLEAGLVVTILIGAVRRLAPGRSLAGVWLGVAAAAVLSLSFGAVLTFTRAALSPKAQEVFGGVASLVAVVLVTSMIFWMRSAARGLSGDLRSRVGDALNAGGPALVVTAFIAVAREGLEAALFIWTNAQAAGSSTSPVLGAVIGILIAVALCTALYQRALRINLGAFFTVTGGVLVVIVAGVLAYGLTDLQDAGVVPGVNDIAFDISAHVPTGTWWSETIRGITNLNNRMSWIPVIAYIAYIAVVMTLFLRRSRGASAPATAPSAASTAAATAPAPVAALPATPTAPEVAGPRRSRRRVLVASCLVLAVPVVGSAVWVAVDHNRANTTAAGAPTVTITDTSCGSDWAQPVTGSTTYAVRNSSGHAVDVELVTSPSQAVAAEIEVLGPGTTRDLATTLAGGAYQWKCLYSGAATTVSTVRTPSGPASDTQVTTLTPATGAELAPVLVQYRAYVAGQLASLDTQVAQLQRDVASGNRSTAERDWLTGYLTYHRIGAAYNAFGDAGAAVDGLASGLPGGTADPGFAGFHRIEFGLWHQQSMAQLVAPTRALVAAVTALHAKLPSFTFDPNDVTTRAHEILEDTVRFVLTSQSDYGCGCGYLTAQADLTGDQVLVDMLASHLTSRSPDLVSAIHRDAATLQAALTPAIKAGTSVADAPQATREAVDGATSQLAETLAPIPDLLEVKAA